MRETARQVFFVFLSMALLGYALSRTFIGGAQEVLVADPFLGAEPDQLAMIYVDRVVPQSVRIPVGGILEIASRDESYHDMRQKRAPEDIENRMDGMDAGVTHGGTTKRFNSGIFGPEEAYRVRIDHPGLYDLEDYLHPEIIIHVEAYERSK